MLLIYIVIAALPFRLVPDISNRLSYNFRIIKNLCFSSKKKMDNYHLNNKTGAQNLTDDSVSLVVFKFY